MPTYAFSPPFWARTIGPIHCPPVSCVEVTCTCEYWSLGYDSPVRISPDTPVPAVAVPAAAWETIASPPSLTSVHPAPRLPFARLKLSEPVGGAVAAQATTTLVTFADPIVPEPLLTVQVCPDGFVSTVTA